jgi:uncharacterized protein YcfJ
MKIRDKDAQTWAALIGVVLGGIIGAFAFETVGQALILAAVGGVIGAFVPEGIRAIRRGSGGPGSASDAYRRLLRMTMGDRAQAERLIRYERRYAPDASREELIQRAIDRLEYDRMR